ncbi:MAG: beta-ketoacyl-[acyl-carrier-protein] synthase family protein [Sedimentisphaerales bacterium]|nr:beta-ketoacyl-[acyl-carrier-protein] synthase family protein [Sedimentisphaerales bacterium]
MRSRRVVITGCGAITPLGINVPQTWNALLTGGCGIGKIKAFDPVGFSCKLAGEVGPYKFRDYLPKSYRKAAKLMSRDIELSIIASDEAIKDAGVTTQATDPNHITIQPERTAVQFGAGLISCDLLELAPSVAVSLTDGMFDIHKWGKAGIESLTPIWLLKYLPNMLACHVGIIHDIRGPSNSITCGEVGGHLAIAEAADVISRGSAEMALAGGCEAKVNPIVMIRQCLLKRATSASNDDPEGACRPFAADAAGSVFGEAAGVVVLEELESAQKRKAKIYAEIIGTGSSTNINPVYEHLEADGKGIEIAIKKAMGDAGIMPGDLDLIIPQGTGIPQDDAAEATAITRALGDVVESIPAWPIKSMMSHTGAAAGTLDVIAAIKAISESRIGPPKNCEKKAEGCRLKLTCQDQERPIRHALCCGYTFGGQTAAIVLKKLEGGS